MRQEPCKLLIVSENIIAVSIGRREIEAGSADDGLLRNDVARHELDATVRGPVALTIDLGSGWL